MEQINHRGYVGGMWDAIGKLQFEFLVARGLERHHRLLDVGCGCLRGGVHFIEYLDARRYFGVDRDQALLDAGRNAELPGAVLMEKAPTLSQMASFDFRTLGVAFDFGIAQSVFTHLPIEHIRLCVANVAATMTERGRFFATFLESARPRHRDPFRYPFAVFEEMGERLALSVRYIGAWGHPRNQRMMEFKRA